jgi:delta-aminolevulinic acid dehydratase/porphobilinogen synthase
VSTPLAPARLNASNVSRISASRSAAPAAAAGAGDRDALILETLLAFKRAGASGILTYHAVDAARLIHG